MQRNEQRPNKKSPQPNAGERTIGELLVERWRRQAGHYWHPHRMRHPSLRSQQPPRWDRVICYSDLMSLYRLRAHLVPYTMVREYSTQKGVLYDF